MPRTKSRKKSRALRTRIVGHGLRTTSTNLESAKAYSPYNTTTNLAVSGKSEDELFDIYLDLWDNNALARFCVEFLLHSTYAPGYTFRGKDPEGAAAWWRTNRMHPKLFGASRDKFRLGNGYLIPGVDDLGNQTYIWVTGDSIKVERTEDEKGLKYTQPKNDKMGDKEIKGVVHFKGIETQTTPYGRSYYRPVINHLRSLADVLHDIPIALKRIAYAALVLYTDLQNYITQEEKNQAMADAREDIQRIQSAGANFVLDNKNKLDLVGQGTSTARLLPTNELIAPIVTEVLLNFFIALGMYLQQGANKSLIEGQETLNEEAIKEIRNQIAEQVNSYILPQQGFEGTYMVFNPTLREVTATVKAYAPLIESGIITPEEFRAKLGLEISKETFSSDAKSLISPEKGTAQPVQESPGTTAEGGGGGSE